MAKKKDILPKSELVTELNDNAFIKQPYLYATIGGDFTLTQRSIMIEIINSLQDRFNAFLKRQKDGIQLNLFEEEEKSGKDIMTFRIKSSSLGVRPDAYALLAQTCDNMLDMKASWLEYDENTGNFKRVFANLFVDISIPESKKKDGAYKYKVNDTRRANYVEVRMAVSTLKYLCDLSNGFGYMQHVRRIARLCRRKRTPSIYIYLAKFKDLGSKKVNLLELKKFLGLIETVSHTDSNGAKVKIEKDMYPKFSRFCSTVLDPIKEDLDHLAAENTVDFTFDYEPVYKSMPHRGNPEEILFTIKLSGMGEELMQQRKRLKIPSDIWELLRTEFRLTDTDLKNLSDMLPDSLVSDFRKEVLGLKAAVKNYTPRNVKAYIMTILKNFIEANKPKEDSPADGRNEEKQKESPQPDAAPSEDDMKEWNAFMLMLKEYAAPTDYNTWLQFIGFGGRKDNHITLDIPTPFFYSHLINNFGDIINRAFTATYGKDARMQCNILQK